MSDWLDVLNDEQREAVEATEGYICLHAGAGTGKTRTLTYRYAYLINEYGISPRSVWCVTFTNKAAIEMKQRVQQLCGNAVGNPFVTTFHAFCALFLREEIMAVGWPRTFTISDVSDVKDLIRPLYRECGVDGKKLSLKKAWEFIDSKKGDRDYIPALIGADSMELMNRSEAAVEDELKLFWRYLFAQRTTYSLDFDDLILLTLHILNHFPEVRERWQKRLEYIMVDEFQDIDSDQYELVEILAGINNNLFIVGDPDQTIYSFRGARVEYFKNFTQAHAGNGRKLNLTCNYRSQGNILQAAYSVISHNPDPDRLPLVAMRTDITIDDMATTRDPNIRKEDQMSPEVAARIASSSHYSQHTMGRARKDRLSRVTGYKAQQKLERIGLEPSRGSGTLAGGLPSGAAVSAAGDGGSRAGAGSSRSGAGSGSLGGSLAHSGVQVSESSDGLYSCETVVDNFMDGLRRRLTEVPDKNGRALSMKPVITHASSIYVEADYVCQTIQEIRELYPESSVAILYRAHYVAMQFENALVTSHIPYNVIGDQRFFDRKEIRDVIAYIRLRVNLDDDVAFRRVVNVPPRGFGKKRMEHLEAIARSMGCSLFHALAHSADDTFLYKQTEMERFVSTMTAMNSQPFRSPADDFELIINNTGYEEWIKVSGEDERLENIASLKTYLNDFKRNQDDEVNLADFISNVTLMTSMDENRPDAPVRLMTVHNAKGLEFDYVFVVSVNEAVFPSKKAINELNVEEERRLMYVAMTRARKQLFISEAGGELQNRSDPSAKIKRQPSRFLSEVNRDEVIEVGGTTADAVNREQGFARNSGGNHMAPGERFFHKLLGNGVVREVREADGEYLVFYEKLGRERTLAFTAKFERLGAPAAADAPDAAAAAAAAAVAAAPVGQPESADARNMTLAQFLNARKGKSSTVDRVAMTPHNFNYPEGDVDDDAQRSMSAFEWLESQEKAGTVPAGASPWAGSATTSANPAAPGAAAGAAAAGAAAPGAAGAAGAGVSAAGAAVDGASVTPAAAGSVSPYGQAVSPFAGSGRSPFGGAVQSPFERSSNTEDLWSGLQGGRGSPSAPSTPAEAGAASAGAAGAALTAAPAWADGDDYTELQEARSEPQTGSVTAQSAWGDPDDSWFDGGDFNDSNDGDDDEFVPVEALAHARTQSALSDRSSARADAAAEAVEAGREGATADAAGAGRDASSAAAEAVEAGREGATADVAGAGRDASSGAGSASGAAAGAAGGELLAKYGSGSSEVNNYDLEISGGYGFGRGRSMRELKYLMPSPFNRNSGDQQ